MVLKITNIPPTAAVNTVQKQFNFQHAPVTNFVPPTYPHVADHPQTCTKQFQRTDPQVGTLETPVWSLHPCLDDCILVMRSSCQQLGARKSTFVHKREYHSQLTRAVGTPRKALCRKEHTFAGTKLRFLAFEASRSGGHLLLSCCFSVLHVCVLCKSRGVH